MYYIHKGDLLMIREKECPCMIYAINLVRVPVKTDRLLILTDKGEQDIPVDGYMIKVVRNKEIER